MPDSVDIIKNDAFADCHSSKTVRVSNPKGYIDEGYHDSTLMKAHLRMDTDILMKSHLRDALP
jgi:hypothetical protein